MGTKSEKISGDLSKEIANTFTKTSKSCKLLNTERPSKPYKELTNTTNNVSFLKIAFFLKFSIS